MAGATKHSKPVRVSNKHNRLCEKADRQMEISKLASLLSVETHSQGEEEEEAASLQVDCCVRVRFWQRVVWESAGQRLGCRSVSADTPH